MAQIANPLTVPRGDRRYLIRFINVSWVDLSIAVGDILFVNGNSVPATGPSYSDTYPTEKADPSNVAVMPAAGVLVEITSSGLGVLQFEGVVKGVYTGLTNGSLYKVGEFSTPVRLVSGLGTGKVYQQDFAIALGDDELLLSQNFSLRVRINN